MTTAIKVFAHFKLFRIEFEIIERLVLASLRRPFLCVLVVVWIAKNIALKFAVYERLQTQF